MDIDQFQTSFLTCVVVYLWTRTDAFYEYIQFFNLGFFSSFEDYSKFKAKTPVPMNFIDFLVGRNPSFLMKLISCPICLSIYLNLIFYISFSLVGVKQANLFFSIYLSWLSFFTLEKLNSK